MSPVEQIEQLVRISREFGRESPMPGSAPIYNIGMFYCNADETLAANGFVPNRAPARGLKPRLVAVA